MEHMDIITQEDLRALKELLKVKHLKIPSREINIHLGKMSVAEQVFPETLQESVFVQLLHTYEHTKKKEVIILEEFGEKQMPASFLLGVLAEDWPGMSNSILGIVHQKARNVTFVKGLTLEYDKKPIGVVILCFQVDTWEKYEEFILEKKELVSRIREASQGNANKSLLLEDEAVKSEIYSEIVKQINKSVDDAVLRKELEESGEALKFVSTRSREYLEERKLKDLANLIIDNYQSQKTIRNGRCQEIIKIKNFDTKYEQLTGITFVCREGLFSVEDFLKMLNFIAPNHNIKHHKSFVTRDSILVYRLEIVDQNEKPLSPEVIRSIEKNIEKLITISVSEEFSKLKTMGGYEHYARAIIPFLMEELKRTRQPQVFINVDKKTEFLIHIKLIVVSFKAEKKRIYDLISRLSLVDGIDVDSTMPPKIYGEKEVNLLKLTVKLGYFKSVQDIYGSIKEIVKKLYGDIRDFDEGFREIYIQILNQLLDSLQTVNAALIRDIFFSIDELYRIEMQPRLLSELIRLCSTAVEEAEANPGKKITARHQSLPDCNRTLLVVAYDEQKKLLSRVLTKLRDVPLYFTRIDWNQRSYLLMILYQDNKPLDNDFFSTLIAYIESFNR